MKPDSIHQQFIQRAVNSELLRPDFHASLPVLAPSAYTLMQGPRIQRDASQTEGDGLAFEFVGDLVADMLPWADLAALNSVRQVLTSNETFRFLLFAVGVYRKDPALSSKQPGDAFEIYLKAFEGSTKDSQRRAVAEWIAVQFGPLVTVAFQAYRSL
ncbi:hypothetical protein DFH06DRAFT_1206983 [Mycena polygramma]|nr:hypothetical protein DFH06DRAFT_1206983 [Mycena polygramma]